MIIVIIIIIIINNCQLSIDNCQLLLTNKAELPYSSNNDIKIRLNIQKKYFIF